MRVRNPSNEFVPVATFKTRQDAECLKTLLVSGGMPAQLQDEIHLQKQGPMIAPKAGIQVQVPARFLDSTKKIMDQQKAVECLRRAIHCPSCDSTRVQYAALARKSVLGRILIFFGLTQPKFYCEDCHFTWVANPDGPSEHQGQNKAAPGFPGH